MPDNLQEQDALPSSPQTEIEYKAGLLDMLYGNAEIRKELLPLVKKVAPHVSIPEVDTPLLVQSTLQSELKPLHEELAEVRRDRTLRAQREALLDAGLDPDADMEKISQLMTDRKIGDFGTAVQLYSLQQQTAEPRSISEPAFLVPNDAKLFQDPKGWAREEADRVLSEMRRGRR